MYQRVLNLTAVVFYLTIIAAFSHAQTGGTAGEFLRYGVGAKALAKGRIFTGIADDVSAIYWNPAGLAQLNQLYVGAMQSQLYFDTQYFFTGLATPLFFSEQSKIRHTFGLGFVLLKNEGFELVDRFDQSEGSFNINEFALSGSYAVNLVGKRGNLNFGFAPIYFRQDIQGESGGGWGFNAGLLYQPIFPGRATLIGLLPLKYIMPWRFGVNYRWLGSLKMGNESRDYGNSFNFGISNTAFEDILDWLIIGADPLAKLPIKIQFPAYELEKVEGRKAEHRLGGEVRWRLGNLAILSGRAGYRFGREDFENKFNWGLGVQTDAESGFPMGIDVDFSLIDHPVLGSANQFYVTLRLTDWLRNVRRVQKRDPTGIPESQLWSLLSYYPFDDRVVKEGDGFDVAYKEIIADKLHQIAKEKDDRFVRDRLCDFMGGLCDIEAPAIACDIKVNQELVQDFLDKFRDREADLNKPGYFDKLQLYLKGLLWAGENRRVVNIVTGKDSLISNARFAENEQRRNFFIAYASKEPRDIQRYNTENAYEKNFLKLTEAVYTGNAEPVVDLLTSNRREVFLNQNQYEPFPFLCDGILADDIMFVKAVQASRALLDAKADSIRNLFLPIVFELPHSDLGRVIASKLRELNDAKDDVAATRQIFEKLWERYRALFLSNQAISESSLRVASN